MTLASTEGAHAAGLPLSAGGSSYLDFARVLATNLVIVGHARQIFLGPKATSYGGVGVIIFFLLSGFLITLASGRRWGSVHPQINVFLIDRTVRIFVPFLPILIIVALLNTVLRLPIQPILGVSTGPLAFIGNMLLLNDYPVFQFLHHFIDVARYYPRSYNAVEPFWTIPIEYWTYVVFAMSAFVLVRRERMKWYHMVLVAVALPVFVWNSFAGGAGDLSLLWIIGSVVGLIWFHVGVAASHRPWFGVVMMAFGAIGIVGRIADVGFAGYDMQVDVLIAIAFFGMLIVANAMTSPPASVTKVAAALASYSYTLYLSHNVILIIVREKFAGLGVHGGMVVAILASHAIAIGLYFLFERHYHRVGRRVKDYFLT